MDRKEWDQFYHLLRTVSNSSDEEEVMAAAGIAAHLIGEEDGGYYMGLLTCLSYYGKRFLLEPVCEAAAVRKLKFDRVVEFGAGEGWLSEGMGKHFMVPHLQIDKRGWTADTMVANLETKEGIESVLKVLKPGDLIVMSDFLHCLDNPAMTMANFPGWNTVVLEYVPFSSAYMRSYKTQLERHGAKPFHERGQIAQIFTFRGRYTYNLDPYILTIIGKMSGKEAKAKEAA